jgi:predicted RNase H-like HicB family nuclease
VDFTIPASLPNHFQLPLWQKRSACREAMARACYKLLEAGTCFGEIPGLAGVWANVRSLDKCREVLQEVLEGWLILKLQHHDRIPRLGRVTMPVKAA